MCVCLYFVMVYECVRVCVRLLSALFRELLCSAIQLLWCCLLFVVVVCYPLYCFVVCG